MGLDADICRAKIAVFDLMQGNRLETASKGAVEFDDNNERVLGPLPIEKQTLVIIFQSSHDAHTFGRKHGDVQAELGTDAVALSPAATINRNSRESRRSNVLLRPWKLGRG